MHNITLIATGHKERGICNSNELYRIIERIAPEIILKKFLLKKLPQYITGRFQVA